MPTNTRESGLEALIVNWLVEENGYEHGNTADYNKDYAVDEVRLFRFLEATQPNQMEKLQTATSDLKRRQFLDRLRGEIAKRGVIDVLRKGFKIYPVDLIMFYMTPSDKNAKAKADFEKNIFSVTRQLAYSKDNSKLALDMAIFINGLPVITCELKNQLTKQDVEDAVYQYQNDRDPKELLFQFKRCMVHFAIDDARIKFCTKLDGKKSWFLPFDKGHNDGAGNPPNPNGIMTDYLWKETLTKNQLANIIENYAQVLEEKDEDTGKISYKQIFPRYHQLSAVNSLLADVKKNGMGHKLMSLLTADDIVVTQDFGLAAMVLGKGAQVVNQNGLVFTNENIDKLLMERHIGAKVRRGGGRTKGPAKRTKEDNEKFETVFVKLLDLGVRNG